MIDLAWQAAMWSMVSLNLAKDDRAAVSLGPSQRCFCLQAGFQRRVFVTSEHI